MIKNIEYIKDVIGNNYIGLKVYDSEIYKYLNDFKDYIGEELYDEYTKYQKNRDNNKYHLTILNVMEYNNVITNMGMDKALNYFSDIFKNYTIDDLKLLGIGNATRNENSAYFIVCKSDKVNKLRNALGFENKDLHITIGFKYKDVHGVPKNKIIEKKSNFLKLLSKEYYNSENFEFVKSLNGYDSDNKNYIIEPIRLDNNWIILRVYDNTYVTLSEIDGKLSITGKWNSNNKINILPNTILHKNLNKN